MGNKCPKPRKEPKQGKGAKRQSDSIPPQDPNALASGKQGDGSQSAPPVVAPISWWRWPPSRHTIEITCVVVGTVVLLVQGWQTQEQLKQARMEFTETQTQFAEQARLSRDHLALARDQFNRQDGRLQRERRTELLQILYESTTDENGETIPKHVVPIRSQAVREHLRGEREAIEDCADGECEVQPLLVDGKIDLRRAWLTDVAIADEDFSNVDFSEARLDGAALTNANLASANLTEANLTEANLTQAKLVTAKLTRAKLTGAKLFTAKLTGANLGRANLTGANLIGARLMNAKLVEANLTGAVLFSANLTGANLTGANLTGAELFDVDLTGADLAWADLAWANLGRANLTGVSRFPRTVASANVHRLRSNEEFVQWALDHGAVDEPDYKKWYSLRDAHLQSLPGPASPVPDDAPHDPLTCPLSPYPEDRYR